MLPRGLVLTLAGISTVLFATFAVPGGLGGFELAPENAKAELTMAADDASLAACSCPACPEPAPAPPVTESSSCKEGNTYDPRKDVPPWYVGSSICQQIPGFETMNGIVERSPLLMGDFLISVVKSTVHPTNASSPGRFVEIGTRNGDIFSCVSYFAGKGSSAIEGNKLSHCPALKARGIPHICTDYERLKTPEEFPEAEVYYFWSWPEESEHFLRHIVRIEQKRERKGKGAKLVLGFDTSYSEDYKVRGLIAQQYGGDWSKKIFFDEGDGERNYGVHWPGVWDMEELVRKADNGWFEEIKDQWVVPPKKNPEIFDDQGNWKQEMEFADRPFGVQLEGQQAAATEEGDQSAEVKAEEVPLDQIEEAEQTEQ